MSNAETMPSPSGAMLSISDQVERQLAGARLRILIVGAGIAGATLAALLTQRGARVAMIERNENTRDNGYMLGLMPLGGRVLNGLNLAEPLRAQSLPMHYYVMHNRHGRLIRRFPMAPLVDRFGSLDGIERADLLALLRSACGPIVYGASVQAIAQNGEAAAVTFHDGSRSSVDLVVAADGLHSHTRGLVVKPEEVETFETGWGGWVIWSKGPVEQDDTYREMWSAGWGVGLYPVPGRAGIFLAGLDTALKQTDVESYAAAIEKRLPKGPLLDALKARDREAPSFYWPMVDCRSRVWSRGRVVLLGDAAAGFLPTAGVGASMAMDSAAALADELSRADASHMAHALDLYEKRQRHRVELAQQNSRKLARLMFVTSPRAAWARDQMMRFYTLKRLIKDISKVMDSA